MVVGDGRSQLGDPVITRGLGHARMATTGKRLWRLQLPAVPFYTDFRQ